MHKAFLAKIYMNTEKPIILVTPLDWGLGHTTRCVPIIHELQDSGCQVVVGCNSNQKVFLANEFPHITFVNLQGYSIRYGNNRIGTIFRIISQIPKVLRMIKAEKKWLHQFCMDYQIDAVISDNRYGMVHPNKPCYLITHQLNVDSKLGRLVNGFVGNRLEKFIKRFRQTWIPDWKEDGLAGNLSHPNRKPKFPYRYIDPLSRFQKLAIEEDLDFLIILSGPEPQRTKLEQLILEQFNEFNGRGFLVRGSCAPLASWPPANITVHDFATSGELNVLMCRAKLIVCRAGYTSIMDIIKLGKRSIIIPTPGQGEQEYLADYLMERNLVLAVRQSKFNLVSELKVAAGFNYKFDNRQMNGYRKAVADLVKSLMPFAECSRNDL